MRSDAEPGRRESRAELLTPILTPVDPVRAAAEEVAALLIEVDELNDRSERLRARATASEREAVLLSEHLTTKSALAGELRSEASALRRELEAARVERTALNDLVSALRAQLDGRVAELEAAGLELGQARAERDVERALAYERAREAHEVRVRLEEAERTMSQLRDRLGEVDASVAMLTSQLVAARADAESARADGDLARAEAQRLDGELAVARGELERARAEAAGQDEGGSAWVGRASVDGDPEFAALRRRAEAAEAQAAAARAELGTIAARLSRSGDERDDTSELLAATEHTRDEFAHHLKASAATTLGRLAHRWIDFGERHPRAARAIRAPFGAIWMVVTLRWPKWLRQHPLFDRDWYVETNLDVGASRLRPWWHFVRHGTREGRAPNRYFDHAWYLRTYPDVKLAGMDPLDHYYRRGCWEGRDPSPRFQTDWYLAQHPEVLAAGMNPLLHFMRIGVHEGHDPAPPRASGRDARAARPTFIPATPMGRATDTATTAATPAAVAGRVAAAGASPPPVSRTSPVRADVRGIRKLVSARLPRDARLGVVSDGQDALLTLDGVDCVPVPRASDGRRARDVPRNDLSAIAHVEALRAAHIDYLLAPDPSLWLTVVPGLVRHLDDRYARLSPPDSAAMLWDVRVPRHSSAPEAEGADDSIQVVLRTLRECLGREPSILDWGSGHEIARSLPTATVFAPPDPARDELDYADDSVDVVVIGADAVRRLGEARRIALAALIIVSGDEEAPANVEWLTDRQAAARSSVSVIVPTYNDVTMVAACLRSLQETLPAGLETEIVVADDGSEEPYRSELETLVAAHERVRLVRRDTNAGYIAAISSGAAEARHEILVLLNNDTVLLPGWLEPLMETLRERPEVGVVGGMLLYPDGRLQEAGCAIFRDGSATKIGYGDSDPTLPYYAHPRSVDYVSGALMATPRALFEELGGLDEAYGFGYYEDGDYCFKARRAGRDVMYEPRSRVVHVEGGTAGMDLTRGAKQFQARNQALFVERWHDELEHLPERPEPLDLHASRDLIILGRPDA